MRGYKQSCAWSNHFQFGSHDLITIQQSISESKGLSPKESQKIRGNYPKGKQCHPGSSSKLVSALPWLAYSPSVRAVVRRSNGKKNMQAWKDEMKLLSSKMKNKFSANFGGWKTATNKNKLLGEVILIHLDNNSMIQCSVFDLPPLSLGAEHETLVEMKNKIGSR